MASLKVERGLALGQRYRPDMGDQAADLEPFWHTLGEQVREADDLGYDSLVIPEVKHDPFIAAAIAAQEPSRVELITGIALAFPRSPTAMAHTAWDLQRLSGGRFLLGLGSQVKGHIQRRFATEWTPPAPRMKEYIQALQAVWRCWQDGERLEFLGESYRLNLMTPNFTPPPQKPEHAHIPILLAAVGPAMLRVAGEVADGVRLHGIVTRKYMDEIAFPNLRRGAERAGRTLDNFQVSGGAFLVTGRNQSELEQALESAKKTVAFYGSTRSYHLSFELEGWEEVASQLHVMSMRNQWAEMAAVITDEMVQGFAVVGTYDEIAAKIKQRLVGCTRFSFDMPTQTEADRGVAREIVQDLHRPE